MTDSLLQAIVKKSFELRKQFKSPTCIWEAMKQCGVRDNDPARAEIYKEVVAKIRKDITEAKKETERKHTIYLRDARKHELNQPEDTYRNDL